MNLKDLENGRTYGVVINFGFLASIPSEVFTGWIKGADLKRDWKSLPVSCILDPAYPLPESLSRSGYVRVSINQFKCIALRGITKGKKPLRDDPDVFTFPKVHLRPACKLASVKMLQNLFSR